ncbi:MAG TPA: sialidase family protein [Candidatus Dormibacteraeota bacterium]|jgi:hypothetical protein|nr:sialidase family protein [Candidatus Dormibacteraeota bacterium]
MARIVRNRRAAGVFTALGVAAGAVASTAFAAGGGGTAGTGFTAPVVIPQSAGLGEPSLGIDSSGRLFVTAPQSLGNVNGGGSPVWTSTSGGAAWSGPVHPTGDPVSGGDTDIAFDSADNAYQADLWLGNSAMAVSTDHGASFVASEYGHTQPGDDRPWLAYSRKDNAMYMVYDGVDAVHVAKSAPLVAPQAGLLLAQDIPVIVETAVSANASISGLPVPPVRMCVCPPGGIAVDQASGSVYVTYSRQNGGASGGGVGVSRSDDGGLTWTHMSIPGTGSTGSAFDVEYNFAPVKVDSAGTVYVAWGEGRSISSGIANGGVAVRYAYSKDRGATWSTPVTLSTTSNTTTFPTLDVVSPGVVDVAWYGTSATGDPNTVPASASWDVDFTQVTAANTATPSFTPVAAVTGIHTGCIQSGNAGAAACGDRSLLDFFQLAVDRAGKANIIYTAGQLGSPSNATNLYFVRQS